MWGADGTGMGWWVLGLYLWITESTDVESCVYGPHTILLQKAFQQPIDRKLFLKYGS